jgi:monovalent cation:H+ antiporter-2, CPA2 family
MHQNLPLILTLTGGLAAALILGYITQRLRLSPIVGYLLAGIVVGPFTPGFTADRHLAEQLAEIGIILLMFGVGLSFHLKELLAVRRIAIPGAVVQSTVATALGTLLGLWTGWGLGAGVVFGLAVSVASTVVLIRVLADYNDLHTPTGHIAVGWLVVEDLFTVLILVILPALAAPATGPGLWPTLGLTAVKLGALVWLTFYVGAKVIPWLLGKVAATRSRELFTLTVLVVALGIAVGSAQLFGVSMALGAFLAGMIVGRSDFSLRAASDALPMRDAFAVLFFVSVGMLFDWRLLVDSWPVVLATLGIVLLGKPLAALAIVLLLGHPMRSALAVAVALAQVGEFSFILAALGMDLQVMPAEAYQALVAASIISISLNPLLYRFVDPTDKWLATTPLRRKVRSILSPVAEPHPDDRPSAVIVGYGPVGRSFARILRENLLRPAVIELNLDTVRQLREQGVIAVYGDASHADTLRAAGVQHARALILTASGLRNAEEIIRQARQINPGIRTLARANYVAEMESLAQAGADEVFTAEIEIAMGMTESILNSLGATPEQMDRERDRVRRELSKVGAPPRT